MCDCSVHLTERIPNRNIAFWRRPASRWTKIERVTSMPRKLWRRRRPVLDIGNVSAVREAGADFFWNVYIYVPSLKTLCEFLRGCFPGLLCFTVITNCNLHLVHTPLHYRGPRPSYLSGWFFASAEERIRYSRRLTLTNPMALCYFYIYLLRTTHGLYE